MSAWVGLEVIKLPSVFHLYQAPQCDVSTNHNGELSIVFIFFNNLPWCVLFAYAYFDAFFWSCHYQKYCSKCCLDCQQTSQ